MKELGYINVRENNDSITFAVIDDISKVYIINEVLQALDATIDIAYMVSMLLGCKYPIVSSINNKLPVYTVNLDLCRVTYEHNFTGSLEGFFNPVKNYIENDKRASAQ